MKRILTLWLLLLVSIIVNANSGTEKDVDILKPRPKHLETYSNKNKLKVILKLDDFNAKNGRTAALPTMDYLVNKKIKASIGFIAAKCDESTLSVYAPYLNAKNDNGDRLFEVWHHGFDHINPEFNKRDYDYQKTHFEQADKLIKDRLRLQMHSFGAPFNSNDSTANKVIAENPHYKVTMFNRPAADSSSGILNLSNSVNMEVATGKPNYAAFIKNYNSKKEVYTDCMVLQGHPNLWKTEELDQFKQIIDFLLSEGCEFDLPYNYYQSIYSKPTKQQKKQQITFGAFSDKKLNNKDFNPKAKASSGLKVLYNSSNPAVATIVDGKIHIVGLGTTTITASQMGNRKFSQADYVSHTLIIN